MSLILNKMENKLKSFELSKSSLKEIKGGDHINKIFGPVTDNPAESIFNCIFSCRPGCKGGCSTGCSGANYCQTQTE